MNIKPLQDRVIVLVDEAEEKQGGIIIPDIAKAPPQYGTVIAAGDGKITDKGVLLPFGVKVGDRILFTKYSGVDIKLNGEDLLLLDGSEILGVVEEA